MTRRRVRHSTLFEALAAAQAEVRSVLRTAEAESDDGRETFTYAPLDVVAEVAFDVLRHHHIDFAAWPTMSRDRFVLRYKLRLTTAPQPGLLSPDESMSGTYPLPNPQAAPQVLGAAITFARRNVLVALAGLAPRDDQPTTPPAEPQRPPVEPKPSRDHEGAWVEEMKKAEHRGALDALREQALAAREFTDVVQGAYLARAGVLARAAQKGAE